MSVNRFFRFVWRANSLLILLVCLLLLVGLAPFVVGSVFPWPWQQSDGTPVEVADAQIDTARFRMGDFERLRGTPYLRAPLFTEGQSGTSFSSGRTGRKHYNFFFYDIGQRHGRWLVKGNSQLFLSPNRWSEELRAPGPESHADERPVLALLYQVVDADTDGDSALTEQDRPSVAVSDSSGTRYTVLLREVQGIRGQEVITPTTVLVFYVSSKVLRVAEINFVEQKVVRDGPISTVPEGPADKRPNP